MARLSDLRDEKEEKARGKAFWERYDALKAAQKTTDEWIARDSGFKPNHISAWKSRFFIPRADYVNHIAKRLGETSEYLLDGLKSPYISSSDANLLARAKRYKQVIDGLDLLEDVTRNALSRAIIDIAEPRMRRPEPASPNAPLSPLDGIPLNVEDEIDLAAEGQNTYLPRK